MQRFLSSHTVSNEGITVKLDLWVLRVLQIPLSSFGWLNSPPHLDHTSGILHTSSCTVVHTPTRWYPGHPSKDIKWLIQSFSAIWSTSMNPQGGSLRDAPETPPAPAIDLPS